jgi:sterol desaturase/sphingolipid hydroxylase (fatty acid hydroxylase superfamily)
MEAVFTLLIPLSFVSMLVIERVFPARRQQPIRFWLVQGIAFFIATAAIGGIGPAVFAVLLAPLAPLHLDHLPLLLAGILGFLATDVLQYAVHRLSHNWPWLWRWTHQMHHAAERVDIAGAAIFHPFDIVLGTLTTTVAVVLLGLSPEAAAMAGFLSAFTGMFSHLNVRTPRWLGYIIQRPEAHAIHHARGVHAYNYGNFMLWDIVLGTFRNPETFTEPAGFWDGASRKFFPMLLGRDVGEPTT